RYPTPLTSCLRYDPGAHVLYGLAVDEVPKRNLSQPRFLLDGDLSIRLRADVEQEIAALGSRLDQNFDELSTGFINLVRRLPRPFGAHREIALPGSGKRDPRGVLLGSLHHATRAYQ